MGNYARLGGREGGPVKMVGKQRGGEGTQREGTQRRFGMSHQLSKVRERILNGAKVSGRKGLGEKKEEMWIKVKTGRRLDLL